MTLIGLRKAIEPIIPLVDPFKELRAEMTEERALVLHKAANYDQVEYLQQAVNWQEVLEYSDAFGGEHEVTLSHALVSHDPVPRRYLDARRRRSGLAWWRRRVSLDGPVDDGVRP